MSFFDLYLLIEGIQLDTSDALKLMKLVDSGEYRSGDCYISSRRFAMKIDGEYVEGILVGGLPRRKIYHAWVEKDGNVYDPTIPEALSKEDYYKIYSVKEVYRNTGIGASLKSAREGKSGPLGEVPENI